MPKSVFLPRVPAKKTIVKVAKRRAAKQHCRVTDELIMLLRQKIQNPTHQAKGDVYPFAQLPSEGAISDRPLSLTAKRSLKREPSRGSKRKVKKIVQHNVKTLIDMAVACQCHARELGFVHVDTRGIALTPIALCSAFELLCPVFPFCRHPC